MRLRARIYALRWPGLDRTFYSKETSKDEANEYRKNLTLFHASISFIQKQSTPVVGGRGRIACQRRQGSHLFHQAPKTLLTCPCCPERNTRLPKGSISSVKSAHSGFAFGTNDIHRLVLPSLFFIIM